MFFLFFFGSSVSSEARDVGIVELCEIYGEEYDIDPLFLEAVVTVESHGQTTAANGKYIGLMQLNSETFTGDLTDPETNIKQGTAYLAKLRSAHGDNIFTAYSYYCGECGKYGYYTQKVINQYFEMWVLHRPGKEIKNL